MRRNMKKIISLLTMLVCVMSLAGCAAREKLPKEEMYQTKSDQYVKMLSGNSVFLSMDSAMKEEIREIQRGIDMNIPDEQFEQWKKEYRRIDKS